MNHLEEAKKIAYNPRDERVTHRDKDGEPIGWVSNGHGSPAHIGRVAEGQLHATIALVELLDNHLYMLDQRGYYNR